MATKTDLIIQQGKTFSRLLRWEVPPIVYKAITAITKTAPVRLTVVGHGIPAGWRATVVSAKGMKEINAVNTPPRGKDYHRATVIDVDTVEFNDVNAANYTAYTSGGYLQYNTPVDLTGMTARMTIKDRVGGTELASFTTENGGIDIDTAAYTITLYMAAADTAAFTWRRGVYDLEMVSADGTVTLLLYGDVSVEKEVTTT
jgi:hypothetical protein